MSFIRDFLAGFFGHYIVRIVNLCSYYYRVKDSRWMFAARQHTGVPFQFDRP